jgi:hypothetical protein
MVVQCLKGGDPFSLDHVVRQVVQHIAAIAVDGVGPAIRVGCRRRRAASRPRSSHSPRSRLP